MADDEEMKRVVVRNETLYSEEKTLAKWTEWLHDLFDKVPQEYRDTALLTIETEGGYDGGHHVGVMLCYWAEITPQERARQRQIDRLRAEEMERLAAQYTAQARALRAKNSAP